MLLTEEEDMPKFCVNCKWHVVREGRLFCGHSSVISRASGKATKSCELERCAVLGCGERARNFKPLAGPIE